MRRMNGRFGAVWVSEREPRATRGSLMGAVASAFLLLALAGAAPASAVTSVSTAADTYTRSDRPNSNYGGAARIVAAAGSATDHAFLRFDVQLAAGTTVTKATLRLHAQSQGGSAGVSLRGVSNTTWGERALTWSNEPVLGSVVDQETGYAKGSWVSLDASSLVNGAGSVSMALTTGSGSGSFDSRESAGNRPQLVLETQVSAPMPTPTPTPAPTSSDRLLGVFADGAADFTQIRSIGFNAITTNTTLADLDRAQAAGLKALVWLGGFENEPVCEWRHTDAWVTQEVNKIKAHPAVIGYQIDNEPHAAECPGAPAKLRDRAALVRSLDPNPAHVTMMALYRTEEFDDYVINGRPVTDVIRVGIYPCNINTGCQPERITTKVGVARAAGWTRLWGSPQAFGDEYYRLPSPAELQAILDTWHANGIDDLFAYTWDISDPVVLRDHQELWPVFSSEAAWLGNG
jgi:hypothetical protein